MTEGFKETLSRAVTISLMAIIAVLGVFSLLPAYQRNQSLKRQDADLTRRIEEKKGEIARLQDFQRRFKTDPDLVVRIARENGRVYPGELVFIFED